MEYVFFRGVILYFDTGAVRFVGGKKTRKKMKKKFEEFEIALVE